MQLRVNNYFYLLEGAKLKRKKVILLVFLLLLIIFLYQVRVILLPFVLAILLAYLINPIINKLIDNNLPRLGALIFVFGVIGTVLGLSGAILVPALIEDLEILADKLPVYIQRLQEIIDTINRRYEQFNLPPTINLILIRVVDRVEELSLQFIERTSQTIIGLVSRMLSLLLAPVLSFYILKDLSSMRRVGWSLIPRNYRTGLQKLLERINLVLFCFLKGQLIVSLLVGVLAILGLYILEVKFALLLGVFAGVTNVIPYFGPFIGILPAVIVASFDSFQLVLWVIVLFFIIQQLEGNIISPKIMGDELGLHPVLIIFSLLAGGELFGVVGMLIAIPTVAIIKEVLNYLFYEILIAVDNR
ncbi:AI-2E family transporter [Natroniella acetigena]|uniref:AI-2E family transporter n=1 Tax=Natroniella acetigena TaxID=52004 RepID=UPI00200B7221|nr:AI-2E family transporter [Natroniella acetigena]MCK8828420.1 AI-2E family transporter [Natroniella acetigena]